MQPASSKGTTPARNSAHLRDYWIVVLKRLPWVLASVLVGLAVAWWVSEKQTKLYRATATIEMLQPRGGVNHGSDNYLAPRILLDPTYLNTQLQKLEMPETLREACERSKLSSQPQFQGMTLTEITKLHAGRVTARLRPRQYIVDVSITGPRNEVLDDVTNALVEYFKEEQRDETQNNIERRSKELEERVTSLTSSIRLASLDERNAYESGGFTVDTFDSDYSRLTDTLQQFTERRNQLFIQISDEQAAYDAFRTALEDPKLGAESLSQHPRVLAHPQIAEHLRAIAATRAALDELRARGVGEGDPNYTSLSRSLSRDQDQRKQIQEDFVRAFVAAFEGNKQSLANLDSAVNEWQRKVTEATRVKAKVDEYRAERERLTEDKRSAVREQELLAALTFQMSDAVRIIGRASEPDVAAPVSPNKAMNFTLGGLLALLAGVGVVFLLDYLDDTIRTKDELEKITDVPLLGVIPRIEGRGAETEKRDLYAFHQPKSTVSEAFRGVRTALTMRAHGTRHRVLALSSAGPREGKTTTVINLATVLAYSSKRTLIIDADLRKPRVHKSFGLENTRGLTNCIVGEDDPLAYCLETSVPGVDVLPSGPIPPNPSELLGSERMREIVAALRKRYDHVIIDTPPIGAVTDAAVLGTIVDGVILVVHAGKTRSGIVQRGLEQLRYISAPVEGVILNNLHVRGRYYPGYYTYYYYYSYYGAGKTRDVKRRRDDARESTQPSGAGDASA